MYTTRNNFVFPNINTSTNLSTDIYLQVSLHIKIEIWLCGRCSHTNFSRHTAYVCMVKSLVFTSSTTSYAPVRAHYSCLAQAILACDQENDHLIPSGLCGERATPFSQCIACPHQQLKFSSPMMVVAWCMTLFYIKVIRYLLIKSQNPALTYIFI